VSVVVAEQAAVAADASLVHADVRQSIRNAATLGASLVLTWVVGIGIKLVMPRYLGPAVFGGYQFADAFTATLFIITGFGLDTYIRNEVTTRPDHASDFFGGLLALRFVVAVLLVAGATLVLTIAGKPAIVRHLVLWLGLYQFLFLTNTSLAAILQSVATVSGLAVINVASKALTGIGILVGFWLGGGVASVGVAMFVAELCRSAGLGFLARRHVGLRLRLDPRVTGLVFAISFPFYLSDIAQTAYAKLDVSILSFLTNDVEVGWYGAASNLAGLSLLLTPLILWVLAPMMARASARSDKELRELVCRTTEMILAATIPVTLFLALGADVIIPVVFGSAFAPAAQSLRTIAPVFVLTYMAIVGSLTLVRLERAWTVTWLSVGGLLVMPVLSRLLIPRCLAVLGAGGGGVGAATALVTTEALITFATIYAVREYMIDRRSLTRLAKTLAVAVLVVTVDRALAPTGAVRLIVDALVYVGAVVAWGAIDVREISAFLRGALMRQGAPDAQMV
jgi:O-antigen/teichoic acid export membrane protein